MRVLRTFFKKSIEIVTFIILVLFCSACNSSDKKVTVSSADSVKYNTFNSKDVKLMLLYDENNKFLDTIIPPIIQAIREEKYHGITAKEGIIKDAFTAKRMALAILESFYGKKQIQSEEPITVSLIDNKYWYVSGTLPEGYLGGVAEILIAKEDGRIFYLAHGK